MEQDNALLDLVRSKFAEISPHLDEKTRRVWAVPEAGALGYGSVETMAKATGIARSTIGR